MDYQQTIDYLYSKLPMFSRIGAAAIKADLTNTRALCDILDNPQKRFRSVHVAGTNGKGSTSHMLAAILQKAGYKTGLYTSPHLKDFRERIRINGAYISESFVTGFVKNIQPAIDTIQPSFFEITVAMAFEYFAAEQVDIAVIETGLGGRLDSTNVIMPELSVITNIGWDHMNILGDTLPLIAAEKAGIIKRGVPVVVGEYNSETAAVFEQKARECSAPLLFADQHYSVAEWSYRKNQLTVSVARPHHEDRDNYECDLPGYYQTKNILTVLASVNQLRSQGWKIAQTAIEQGLAHTRRLTGLHGRWELVHQHPDIILDVAHNENGMKEVMAQLELSDHHGLHIVLGMVKDKKTDKVLALLPKTARYYFTKAQIPRALPEDQLQEQALAAGLTGLCFPDVNAAVMHALEQAKADDLILVCGSVFLVGEAIPSSWNVKSKKLH